MSAPGDERIGAAVGPYQVESILGEGGMGFVYRAVAPDGTVVALKLVKEDLAADQIFRRRFEREARIAQQVSNPHVVPVLGSGEHDGIPYLAQRFVGNGSLDDRLKKQGKLAVDEALRVCEQVASGLDALWAAGLVHRDVKPANILLDEAGTAFITDFGLAKDSQASVLTRPGQALGSMDYMAPEQIRGEAVDATADVYGLGCVMFECFAGQPPFADRQGMRILWAHLQDTPDDPCAERNDVPPGFGRVVARALEKDRASRPQTASEYARLLREAAGAGSS